MFWHEANHREVSCVGSFCEVLSWVKGEDLCWEKMLCACSGEQFKFEEPPQSPESLATRDFSASGLSSRTTGDWDLGSKFDDIQVDEAESTLKEALSLNYEVGFFFFVYQLCFT